MTRLNPYIHFKDNTREAMEFYKSVFGGKLDMNTFAEFGDANSPHANKIMHAALEAPNGVVFMASDTPPGMTFNPGNTITMCLSGEDEAELRGYWDKLSVGAKITVPLEKAPWGDIFGILTDKFNIEWMVNVNGHAASA